MCKRICEYDKYNKFVITNILFYLLEKTQFILYLYHLLFVKYSIFIANYEEFILIII